MPTYCKFVLNDTKCTKSASYNLPGQTKRLYCKNHAEQGMVILKKDSRTCIHPDHTDTTPRASFNFSTEKKAIYCKTHALPNMININANMCVVCNKKQPSYSIKDGNNATHCAKCSTICMVDVISRLCDHSDCRKNVTYGIFGGKPEYCKVHALPVN